MALSVVLVQRTAPRREEAPPPPSDAPYKRAITCLIRGDQDGALRYLKDTVRQDTDNVEAYIWLGDLLRTRGEAERALAIHRELSVRHIDDATLKERVYEGLT